MVQPPYNAGEFVVFSAAVNMFEVPSGRLELTPHLRVALSVYGVDEYDRYTLQPCGSYPVPFTWSTCQKELEILDSGGAICRLFIPRAEALAAFQKALGGRIPPEFPVDGDGEVRPVGPRSQLPAWGVTATYTDRNHILCSSPECIFDATYLVYRDKTEAATLLSPGKR